MKRKKVVLLSFITIFIFTLAFISFKIFFKPKTVSIDKTEYFPGNSNGNIINKGMIAENGDYIFFSNISDKGKLYRMKADGSGKVKLCDDSSLYINVSNGWVYYRNEDDNGKIYKIKPDGSERKCLNDEDSIYIKTDGQFLYYCSLSNNSRITRLEPSSGKTKVVCDDSASYLNLADGWLYYSNEDENNSLYKISVNGNKKILLSKDMCHLIDVFDNWIYYSNYSDDFKLSKMNIDGKNKSVLDENACSSINVYGDFVYFNCTDNKYGDSGLFKVKTDGSSREKLNSEFSDYINASGEWVYFINGYDKNLLYKVKSNGTCRQNNDGITVVRSIYDLNNAILGGVDFEIKEDRLIKAFDKAKEIVKSEIKPGMTDLEKEIVLHNYVVKSTKYNVENYEKERITLDDGSAYGVLVNGIGVCSGYAESMQLLLNLSGVECFWVVGEAGLPNDMGLHAWNIVKIDGEYYHLDATWDDPIPDRGDKISFNYFNLSDDKISSNHKWNKSLYKECNSNRFSYLWKLKNPYYKDGWIYYDDTYGTKYKMKPDGSDSQEV